MLRKKAIITISTLGALMASCAHQESSIVRTLASDSLTGTETGNPTYSDVCPVFQGKMSMSQIGYENIITTSALSDGGIAMVAMKKIPGKDEQSTRVRYDLLVLDPNTLSVIRTTHLPPSYREYTKILEKKDGTLIVLMEINSSIYSEVNINSNDNVETTMVNPNKYAAISHSSPDRTYEPTPISENSEFRSDIKIPDLFKSNSRIMTNSTDRILKVTPLESISANDRDPLFDHESSRDFDWRKIAVDPSDDTVAAVTDKDFVGFKVFNEDASVRSYVNVAKLAGKVESRVLGDILSIYNRPIFTKNGLISVATNNNTVHFFKKDGEHVSSFKMPGKGEITNEPLQMGNGKIAILIGGDPGKKGFLVSKKPESPEIYFFNSNGKAHSSLKLDGVPYFSNAPLMVWSESDNSVILPLYDRLYKIQFSKNAQSCSSTAEVLKVK